MAPLKYKKSPIAKMKEVAKSLPELYLPKPTRVLGKELIAQGKERDVQGKVIMPNTVYVIDRPCKVDHLEELKKRYKKDGDAGVSSYAVEVVKKKSEQNKQKAPVVNTI